MNKKSATQQILLYIFYLIMAFIILYSTTSYLSKYFNGMEFNKEFVAKDLGLAIDTLSFSPSEIEIKYHQPKEFIVENKDSILRIKTKELEISKSYNLISDVKDFSKKSNEITIKV